MSTIKPQIEPSWKEELNSEFGKSYFSELRSFLTKEKEEHIVYPPGSQIFAAFNSTPFSKVKVVLIGQDPYHGPGQANGLSFSVKKGITIPPSLKNIYKELNADLGITIANHGDLSNWANQGVLLLNTVLTVRHKTPNSHKKQGWELFTDAAITALSKRKENLVFLLWGRFAQGKKTLVDESKHLIIESAHPSPFSANNGFFGSKPFSKTNAYLKTKNIEPVEWAV